MTAPRDGGRPFAGGLLDEDGAVVGCWVHDALNVLDLAPERGDEAVTAVARRLGGAPRVTLRCQGPCPAPGDAAPSGEGPGWYGTTFRSFLARLRWVDDVLSDGHGIARRGFASLVSGAWASDPREGGPPTRWIESLAELREAIGPFLATLDPRAAELSGAPVLGDLTDASYALLDRTFGMAPLAEFVTTHPSWAGEASDMARHDAGTFLAAAADGPDAVRAALLGMLARAHGPGAARAAERLEAVLTTAGEDVRDAIALSTRRTLHPPRTLTDVGRVLGRMPPGWIPADEASWLAYARCHPAAFECARIAGRHAPSMLGARGDWAGLDARLGAAHGLGPDGLPRALAGVRDMHRAHAAQLLLPAADAADGILATSADLPVPRPDDLRMVGFLLSGTILTAGRSIRRVLEDSRRWHAAEGRIRAAMPRSSDAPGSWPRAWPTWTAGGVTVSEVTDVDGLEAEGLSGPDADGSPGLAHCVGGYAGRCLSGRGRILSLRRASDGARLSTAEVALAGGRPVARQHAGRRNAPPPAEAAAAFARYLGEVAQGHPVVDAAALAPVAPSSDAVAAAGYDFHVPGAWESVRDAWAPVLPRRLRGVSREDLVALARVLLPCKGPRWLPSLVVPRRTGDDA